MRQDDKFTFQVFSEVSDGMGGSIREEINGSSFYCSVIPVKAQTVLKEYGIISTEAFKVITKDTILNPLESLILKHGEQRYKIIEHLPLKFSIFLVEKVKS